MRTIESLVTRLTGPDSAVTGRPDLRWPACQSDAEKAKAAALQAVPGATIDKVETDADGAVYEAHVTKSDGTKATVKFDKDFNVTGIEAGMGTTKR